jgi:hypothetical protein
MKISQVAGLSIASLFLCSALSSFQARQTNELTIPARIADTLKLPPGVDPNDEAWKGIDLSPKDPVKALSAADEAKQILLPPGYVLTPF